MPNKRSPEAEYREKISVRLPRWKIKALEEMGQRTEQIEIAVTEYLKKNKKMGQKE